MAPLVLQVLIESYWIDQFTELSVSFDFEVFHMF